MTGLEQTVKTGDGQTLHTRRREVERPRAEVILVHGFAEHSGRYGPIIDYLVSKSFSVTAYDHRGHGRSGGLPGHVDRFSDYESDLDAIVSVIRERGGRRSSLKIVLIGHSMGGLVTLRYLARAECPVAGAIISAPMLAFAVRVGGSKALLARAGARLAPRVRLPNEIDAAVLSRDAEVGRIYAADPLVFKVVSFRWFAEALRAMDEARLLASQIKPPVLLMHGTADRLVSVDATQALFKTIGSSDKELILYPGYYHELFNEPEKEQLYDRAAQWINAHILAS